MDPTIQQFAQTFNDESELQKAIASMLRKIEGVSGVEITQGVLEHGKDIVFYRAGGLGEPRLFACLVKNERITGSVGSNHGAKTVLLQAEQAFDEPYTSGKGRPERVEHVYVMCPHDCSQTTIDSIGQRLSQRPITFFCGGKLIDLFQRYWPEFLLFNSSILSSYVANLKRGLDQDNALKYLSARNSILGTVIESFSKVYVKQDFYQTFGACTFELEVPGSAELTKPMSLERLSELQSILRDLASFVQASEVWDSRFESRDRQQIKSTLLEIARQIKRSWDEGYLQKTKDNFRIGASTPSKRDAQVEPSDPQSITAPYFLVIDRIKQLADEVSSIVERANSFTASQPYIPSDFLKSKAFLDYCIMVEASRRVPRIVKLAPQPTAVKIDEESLRQTLRAVLIVGPPGFGKSSYCKWNVLADVERLASKKDRTLPVYVPLHQIAREVTKSPQDTFLRSPDLRELVSDPRYNNAITNIRLYLDGLDEVPSTEQQKNLLTVAQRLCEQDNRVSIVVTGREYVSGWWLNWMPRVRIREFSDEQSKALVANWIEDDTQRLNFFSQLEQASTLRPLLNVPLLATLIIGVFRNLRQLPESKVRLYEIFVELLSGGWDLAKNIKREVNFGSVIKLRVLSRLAGFLQLNERRDCSERDLKRAMKDVMPRDLERFGELSQELIEDGLLMQQGSAFYFSHLSFQEYLAAKDLSDPSGRRPTNALRWYLSGNDWWREVLLFYISMQGPQDAENWIIKTVDRLSTPSLQIQNRAEREFGFLMEYLMVVFPGYKPKRFQIHI